MDSDQSEVGVAEAGDAPEQAPAGSPIGGSGQSVTGASGALGDAIIGLLRVVARRGRSEMGRAASDGRVRLELRQLKRDRAARYEKLGREVQALIDGNEVTHPGLVRGVDRIRDVEKRIAEVEARMGAMGAVTASVATGEE